MKIRRLIIVVSTLAAATILGAAWAQSKSTWPYKDELEAVTAAPKNHKVLYEDDNVRIVEVTIRPGEKENLHGHKYSSVFIIPEPFAAGHDFDGNGKPSPSIPRSLVNASFPLVVRMGPQAPHAYQNTDTVPNHFYRFEFKKMDFTGPGIGYLLQQCGDRAKQDKNPLCG